MSFSSTLNASPQIVIRRKFTSASKLEKKHQILAAIESQKCNNSINCSNEVEQENYSMPNFIEFPGFDKVFECQEKYEKNTETEDFYRLAKEKTRDSLTNILTIEDNECQEKYFKSAITDIKTESETFSQDEKKHVRHPNLHVSTDLNKHRSYHCASPNSVDSSPHLYIDYHDRLKNILLEYFDDN